MNIKEKLKALLEEAAEKMDCPQMGEVADYLIANGVFVHPCKIGQTVYMPVPPFTKLDVPVVLEYKVEGLVYHADGSFSVIDEGEALNKVGSDLCILDREEAEKELKRLCGERLEKE